MKDGSDRRNRAPHPSMISDMLHRPSFDPLMVQWDRLWQEIQQILPRHRALSVQGEARSSIEEAEWRALSERLADLRMRTRRYCEVQRDEAWRQQRALERPSNTKRRGRA